MLDYGPVLTLCAPASCPAGPAISLDTACSSSLSGTHLLQRLLLEGRCRQGLVTAGMCCCYTAAWHLRC